MPKFIWDVDAIAPLRDALFEFESGKGSFSLGSDYGITDLIQPPKIVILRKRYAKEIQLLPKDLHKTWSAFRGNAIHGSLEWYLKQFANKNPNPGYYVERKLFDKIKGRKIVGKFDVYINGALYDYKNTSTYKYIVGDYEDYEAQLNCYAYLLKPYGLSVDILYLILLFTDWNKGDSMRNTNYPKQDFVQVALDGVWSYKKQEEYIYSRLDTLIENERKKDADLPLCADADMWARANQYAVYLSKLDAAEGKRALRVLPSAEEAHEWAKESKKVQDGGGYEVIFRPGVRTRCENFCQVNQWCKQYQEYLKRKGK